ncbi:884_t:CDS:2, partial [Racocetra persica]
YSNRDNLAIIWSDVSVTDNQQNYIQDNFININTVHNDLINSLDNFLSVREDYLATTYNDTIGFEEECLATVKNYITNIYNNMAQNVNINFTEEFSINVEDFFSSWDETKLYFEKYTKLARFSIYHKHFEVNNIGIICYQTFKYSFASELVSNK